MQTLSTNSTCSRGIMQGLEEWWYSGGRTGFISILDTGYVLKKHVLSLYGLYAQSRSLFRVYTDSV